jgi:hypothetical protein
VQATRLKSNELDLAAGEYVNIEELALAHIYIAILVLVKYEPSTPVASQAEDGTFCLSAWRRCMQNVLSNYKRELFGSEKVTNLNDLRSLKYDSINHRHVITAKPYICRLNFTVVPCGRLFTGYETVTSSYFIFGKSLTT